MAGMLINYLLIINTMPQTCSNLTRVTDALWKIYTLNEMYQFPELENHSIPAKAPRIAAG
jgi:hypothetical protein